MNNDYDDPKDDFNDIFNAESNDVFQTPSDNESAADESSANDFENENVAEMIDEPEAESDPALQDFASDFAAVPIPETETVSKKSEEQIIDTPKVSFQEASRYKNKGKVFNRTGTLSIILFTLVAVVFVLVFFPECKKEEKENELDKAQYTYIPEFIKNIKSEEKKVSTASSGEEPIPTHSDDDILAEIGISDESQQKKQDNVAPIYVNQQTSSTTVSTRPETNRNPIQKSITRVAWDSGVKKTQDNDVKEEQSNNPYAKFGLPPKDEYIARTAAQQAAPRSYASDNSGYAQQNNQSNKASFAAEGKESLGKFKWNSDFSLFKGTIISAVLETGINTDLPGPIIARITKNVFSSLDGRFMLIPAGTRLYATYNSNISYSQKRVQIAWNTLIRPDGFEFDLGNMTGVDTQGYTGQKGFVTENLFEYVKAMGIISMFSIINGELDNSLSQMGSNEYTDQLISENRQVINKLSGKLIDRALDIQPTIHVQQGTEINIITNSTIELPPMESYPAQKYIKYQ